MLCVSVLEFRMDWKACDSRHPKNILDLCSLLHLISVSWLLCHFYTLSPKLNNIVTALVFFTFTQLPAIYSVISTQPYIAQLHTISPTGLHCDFSLRSKCNVSLLTPSSTSSVLSSTTWLEFSCNHCHDGIAWLWVLHECCSLSTASTHRKCEGHE